MRRGVQSNGPNQAKVVFSSSQCARFAISCSVLWWCVLHFLHHSRGRRGFGGDSCAASGEGGGGRLEGDDLSGLVAQLLAHRAPLLDELFAAFVAYGVSTRSYEYHLGNGLEVLAAHVTDVVGRSREGRGLGLAINVLLVSRSPHLMMCVLALALEIHCHQIL